MDFASIIYICVFILSLPVSYYIIKASNLEKAFKQGRIMEIRIAYVLAILICSHSIAFMFYMFFKSFGLIFG